MKNIKNIIIAGLAALALFLYIDGCSKKKRAEKAETEVALLTLDKQKSDSVINKLNQTVYTQEVVIVKNQESFKNYTDSMFNLFKKQERQIKNVIAYYKGSTNTTIEKVPVPYIDTLGLKKWEDSVQQRCSSVIAYYEANTISVPRTAKDSTANYSVDFSVRKDSLVVNEISIPDNQQLRFVTLKGGFLKKDTYGKRHFILGKKLQVQVLHSNPLIKVTGQSSVIFKESSNKLIPTLLKVGIGVLIGTRL